MAKWTVAIRDTLEEAAERYPPVLPLDAEAVGDMVTVIFEGAFVVSKSMNDPTTVARQLRQYRNYLELLFGRAVELDAEAASD